MFLRVVYCTSQIHGRQFAASGVNASHAQESVQTLRFATLLTFISAARLSFIIRAVIATDVQMSELSEDYSKSSPTPALFRVPLRIGRRLGN